MLIHAHRIPDFCRTEANFPRSLAATSHRLPIISLSPKIPLQQRREASISLMARCDRDSRRLLSQIPRLVAFSNPSPTFD